VDFNIVRSHPFNPYIIVKKQDQKVQYFTQTFSQMSGFNPSMSPDSIPFPEGESILNQKSEGLVNISHLYEIFQWSDFKSSRSSNIWKEKWIELLIHELRTASLSLDLGSYLVADSYPTTPRFVHLLVKASHRQKISTLIASDFIQLISSPPKISHTSLLNILMRSFTYLPETTSIDFNISDVTSMAKRNDPQIWGNDHFLASFLSSLLYWIPYKITVELQIANPLSVQININSPPEYYLSSLNGFLLISHYLKYIAAFFNGRAWMSQHTITIVFPLVFY
jgi:hypothetical protein